jgi:hypothetical protein
MAMGEGLADLPIPGEAFCLGGSVTLTPLDLAFLGIVLGLFLGGLVFAHRTLRLAAKPFLAVASLSAFWLALTGTLAHRGFFLVTDVLPPRLFLFFFPVLALVVVLILFPAPGLLVERIDPGPLVAFQSFRLIMELILWGLVLTGGLHERMSFEGHNFDVLIGFTAPLVAYYAFSKKLLPERAVMVWNVFGILLLVVVATLGALSMPYPFQVLKEAPAPTIMLNWPFVWLPTFVVPMAMLGHLFSLRQLVRRASLRSVAGDL